MVLATLKHGGQWYYLGQTFKMKGATFERLVTRFILMISTRIYELLVLEKAERWPMERLLDEKRAFKHFKFSRYATDFTFQQAKRPSGNMQEAKNIFSSKHKLYGFKVEVSVLPNGFAAGCSEHFAGSVSDIDIMVHMKLFHDMALTKTEDEKEVTDIGILSYKYPDSWALLADEGYQGAVEFVRSISPRKTASLAFIG